MHMRNEKETETDKMMSREKNVWMVIYAFRGGAMELDV